MGRWTGCIRLLTASSEMTTDNPNQVRNIRELRAVIDQPLLILGAIVGPKKEGQYL